MLDFDVIMDVLLTSEAQKSECLHKLNRMHAKGNITGFRLIFSIDVGDVKRPIT